MKSNVKFLDKRLSEQHKAAYETLYGQAERVSFEIKDDVISIGDKAYNFEVLEVPIEIDGVVLKTIHDYKLTVKDGDKTIIDKTYQSPVTPQRVAFLVIQHEVAQIRGTRSRTTMSTEDRELYEQEKALLAKVRGNRSNGPVLVVKNDNKEESKPKKS